MPNIQVYRLVFLKKMLNKINLKYKSVVIVRTFWMGFLLTSYSRNLNQI